MKTKHILLVIIGLLIGGNANAQILKKLRKKAEQAAERTLLRKTDEIVTKKTEKTIDDATSKKGENDTSKSDPSKKNSSNNNDKNVAYANPSLSKNTEAKRALYTTDVRVVSYDDEKQSEMTSYFDADAVAMESRWVDAETGADKTSYADSEGFFIAYNDEEKRYTKTALMSMPGMNMMAPSMMASAYKLPVNAIYGAMEKMEKAGLPVYPFMHVEFPFVLKPEFYREEIISGNYIETKQSCRGSLGCTKFSVNEPGYEGSYSLFDNEDRLIVINIDVQNDPNFGSGKGKIEYFYESCEVELPEAVEKKMLGQDLFKKGLDPNKN